MYAVTLLISILSAAERVTSASGGVQPRLEISTLQKNLKQFSLFVQALNNIMKLDYKFEGTDAVNWEQLGSFFPYVNDPVESDRGANSRHPWNAI